MIPSAEAWAGPPGILDRGRWSPEVHAGLCAMLAAPAVEAGLPKIACFDWDNTCVHGDIEESSLRWLDRHDGGGREATYVRLCGERGHEYGYTWAATLLSDLDDTQARRLAGRVLEDALVRGDIRWRAEVRDLIAAMQRRGWAVWIVSASAQPLVQTAAQHYGIAADRVLGVRMKQRQGRFVPELDEPLTWRHGKVSAIERHIQRVPDFVAGDTDTDIEMLSMARHALLFDRGNLEAREHALRLGWWLQPALP